MTHVQCGRVCLLCSGLAGCWLATLDSRSEGAKFCIIITIAECEIRERDKLLVCALASLALTGWPACLTRGKRQLVTNAEVDSLAVTR